MLKIGKLADYGLLLTNHLAKTHKTLLTTEELAAATHLPLATVRKLLKKLVDGGVIASTRGMHGGYTLAREPAQLTVADVLNAIDGPIALTQCAAQGEGCNLAGGCDLRENWSYINQVIGTVLRQLTLADMTDKMAERTIHFKAINFSVPQRTTGGD